MIRRFRGRERYSVFENLVALRQNGEVEECIKEFEMLVSQTSELSEEQLLLGYFFVGLQCEVRSQIRPHNPKDLIRAMEIARDVEEVTKETRSIGGGTN